MSEVFEPPGGSEPSLPLRPCRVFRADDESSRCEACGQVAGEHPAQRRAPPIPGLAVQAADFDPEVTRLLQPWIHLPSLDDVLSDMPPPGERLATGIPTLDRHSRGGFVRGRVYTITAPPGFGKTAFWAQLALRWARYDGALSIGFFADEGAWQAAVMMAEGLDFDRDEVEDSYGIVQDRFQEAARDLSIYLPKPDDPETLLDSIEEWVPENFPGPLVVVVDSAQTVRCRKGLEATTPKEQVEALMKTARHVARVRNAIVLVTSKSNRASYASRDPQQRILGLAAGRDSGDIEFDSDALFTLDGDLETGVTLTIQKNRPGDGRRGVKLKMGFDRNRATFHEIDREAAEVEAVALRREKADADWSGDEKKVLAEVRKHPGKSGNMLQELLSMRRTRLLAVLEELSKKGKLEHTKNSWYPAPSGSRDDDD